MSLRSVCNRHCIDSLTSTYIIQQMSSSVITFILEYSSQMPLLFYVFISHTVTRQSQECWEFDMMSLQRHVCSQICNKRVSVEENKDWQRLISQTLPPGFHSLYTSQLLCVTYGMA